MEKDHDVLTGFMTNLCAYLNLKEDPVKCCSVRKHSENLIREGDLSFPLDFMVKGVKDCEKSSKLLELTVQENCSYVAQNDASSSSSSTVEEFREQLIALQEASTVWDLKIEKCEIKRNRVMVYLDKASAFRTTLGKVLQRQHPYGSGMKKHRRIVIDASVSDRGDMDLSQQRLQYLKDFAIKAARLTGYDSLENRQADDDIGLFLTTGSEKDMPDGMKAVICGAVVNARSRTKETKVLAREYLRLRINDMRAAAVHKYGDEVKGDMKWNNLICALGEASVKMELLKVKPSQTVSLYLDSEYRASRELSSKGATFILYNCARISSILRQFHEKEDAEIYPALADLTEVDFTLLKCDEEWHLLHFMLAYPSIVETSVKDIEKGVLKPYLICIFLSSLCKIFSVYYRRIRILREPREHLIPVMFARIHLLKALQIILQSSLCLLGIDSVNQM